MSYFTREYTNRFNTPQKITGYKSGNDVLFRKTSGSGSTVPGYAINMETTADIANLGVPFQQRSRISTDAQRMGAYLTGVSQMGQTPLQYMSYQGGKSDKLRKFMGWNQRNTEEPWSLSRMYNKYNI